MEVRAAKKKFRIAEHAYEKSKNDPAKREAWKKEESALNKLYKKHRKIEKQGALDLVINQEDMSRIVKFAKTGPLTEIGLVKMTKM